MFYGLLCIHQIYDEAVRLLSNSVSCLKTQTSSTSLYEISAGFWLSLDTIFAAQTRPWNPWCRSKIAVETRAVLEDYSMCTIVHSRGHIHTALINHNFEYKYHTANSDRSCLKVKNEGRFKSYVDPKTDFFPLRVGGE